MNGRSTSGTTGLGTVEVSGRRRVPWPPTRITAWMRSPPADPLVVQAGGAHSLGVKRVAPVDHEVTAHRLGDLLPAELEELGPLRHEYDGVGVPHGVERGVGERDPVDQLA